MESGSQPSIGLRFVIVLGLGLLLPSAIYYGVQVFEDRPERGEFLPYEPGISQEEQRSRQDAYKAAQKEFAETLFWIAAPLGLVAVLFGLWPRLGDIGTGLVLGGLLSVGGSQAGTWFYLSDEYRFFMLLVNFVILTLVAVRRLPLR